MTNTEKTVMPPIENKMLEEAIHALKEGSTPEKQARLSEELRKARLISPCSFEITPDEDGTPRMHADQVKFFLLNTNDGKTFFPAFTSIEETKKLSFGTEQPKDLVRNIRDYGNMLNGKNNNVQGVIINPGSDNIVIPKNLVLLLAGLIEPPKRPAAPRPPMNNAVASYSEPHVYPTKMVTALYDLCKEDERISRVWLKQRTAGLSVSFALIVEADEHDEEIFAKMTSVAEPLSKNIPLDFVWYDEKAEKTIVKDGVAFYDRCLEL